jgi:hypothetical protein
MDEDPSNEAFVLSLLEGYAGVEAEPMDTAPAPPPPPAPPRRTGGPNT